MRFDREPNDDGADFLYDQMVEDEACEMAMAADKKVKSIYKTRTPHDSPLSKQVIKAIKDIEDKGQIAYVTVCSLPWNWRDNA